MLKLDRREFLAGAGAGFLSALGGPAAAALDDADMAAISALRRAEGRMVDMGWARWDA